MKTLETPRLILRKFTPDDFAVAHTYASVRENVLFMPWGPNSEDDTRNFINMAIARADENPCRDYQYAVTLKESGRLIGGCCLTIKENETGELGWILHRDYWKQGYGPELGEALLELGFGELGLHRITANCDADNYGSYRVMEKIGMRREGLFIEGRAANKLTDKKYSDSLIYAILRDEWETRREINYYNTLPCRFEGFDDIPPLSDGGLELVCTDKKPAEPERKYVPAYVFEMQKNGERVGEINLRIGYTDGLYYGGQIGYNIDEPFRGYGYAGAACRMAAAVARVHGMTKLLITNELGNTASCRVCEKLGARLVRVARLPEWHDLYKDGQRYVNIFEWSI
jgi:Acetyltransferases, including N-acetylases of ribosomal proteins